MNELTTKSLRDDDAIELLNDPAFQKECRQLASQVPGFTRLQEADYLACWYHHYRPTFEPVLIYSRNEKGELVGLIGLALQKKKHYLKHAGDAEYDRWLALEEIAVLFLSDVLQLVKEQLKVKKWEWCWMPAGLSASVLKVAAADAKMSLIIESQDSQIWDLTDKEKLKKSLRHSSLKTKINKYKKRGKFHFEHITDPVRLREVMKMMGYQYDFRQEAMFNCRPFHSDPYLVDFCTSMLQLPHTLHANALWLDDQLLAYSMGIEDGERVILGMISFDPSESKLSPGSIILLYLAKSLAEKGYKILDLTPGPNSYKDRYANRYETLDRPTICFSKVEAFKVRLRKSATDYVKKMIISSGVDVNTVRKWKIDLLELPDKIRRITFRKMTSTIGKLLFRKRTQFLFEIDLKNNETLHTHTRSIKQQNYSALLGYQDRYPFLNRRGLLIDATKKFAAREVLFSHDQKGKLQWLAWLKEIEDQVELHGCKYPVPTDGPKKIIYDLGQPASADPSFFEQNLLETLCLLKAEGEEKVLLLLNQRYALSDRCLENLGIRSYQKFAFLSVFNFAKKTIMLHKNSFNDRLIGVHWK